jgi:predicted helicase
VQGVRRSDGWSPVRVLDGTEIRSHGRLFVPATPRYHTVPVENKATEAECEVASPGEEAKFIPR